MAKQYTRPENFCNCFFQKKQKKANYQEKLSSRACQDNGVTLVLKKVVALRMIRPTPRIVPGANSAAGRTMLGTETITQTLHSKRVAAKDTISNIASGPNDKPLWRLSIKQPVDTASGIVAKTRATFMPVLTIFALLSGPL